MCPMPYWEEQVGACVVFGLDDAADATVVAALGGRLAQVLDAGTSALVVDLEGVDLLSSTFVGLLLHARRRVHARGGHMALANVGRRARAVLRTCGVDDVLTIVDGRDDAIRRALRSDVSER